MSLYLPPLPANVLPLQAFAPDQSTVFIRNLPLDTTDEVRLVR